MESSSYKKIRKDLDDLGYHQLLVSECVPLVSRLLGDLKVTTGNLQKYMDIAKRALNEKEILETGAEPYKCDNTRLIKECNELHQRLLQCNEEHERIHKELNRKIFKLETESGEVKSQNNQLKKRVKELEVDLSCSQLRKQKPSDCNKGKLKSSSTSALLNKREASSKDNKFALDSALAMADQKIAFLNREVKNLKEQHLELVQTNEMYRNQIITRDKEIERLKGLLDGGRPRGSVNKDCCFVDVEGRFGKMQDDINSLVKEKRNLESRLKEALDKQHEAMKRALHLADRNKYLEQELKDIDQIALQVEAECNSAVKNNLEKVEKLQGGMQSTLAQIQALEKENSKLKQEKMGLQTDLNSVQIEKRRLQAVLENALEEKKSLTDRINKFTIIENDLNMEIDRLVQLSTEQTRKISELESNLNSKDTLFERRGAGASRGSADKMTLTEEPDKYEKMSSVAKTVKTVKKNKKKTEVSTKRVPGARVPFNSPVKSFKDRDEEDGRADDSCCRGCCSTGGCVQHFKELLDREMEYRKTQSSDCIEALKKEKEYYMGEYHKLLNDMKISSSRLEANVELQIKLNEKEQRILCLEHENKILSQEKYSLMSRLETARDRPLSDMDGPCMKAHCKRAEREREILKADIERLEEERDCLRERIKTMSEGHAAEYARIQQTLQHSEEQIRNLELERRELMQTQGSRRANIACLEEQNESLKEQLKLAKNEIDRLNNNYTQLTNLHSQTDKALSDTQGQLMQVEAELAHAHEKLKCTENKKDDFKDTLMNDVQVLKSKLTQMDREKDKLLNSLDEKTEELARLRQELSIRNNKILTLEATIADLKTKVCAAIEESASNELLQRKTCTEMNCTKRELELANQSKDALLQENRKMKDSLALMTCECRDAKKELEVSRRQIEDLKLQLQQYVAEVKRTEDILSQKEIERNSLLDQFRNLSQEANMLENNNHSLENEATQSKVQLSVALDHAGELERQIEDQQSVIKSYEKQMKEMTNQIARFEFEMRHKSSDQEALEQEVKNLKDLCIKLDRDKENLSRQLHEKNDQRIETDKFVERLRCECEMLESAKSKEKSTVESLEKLLSEARSDLVEQKLLNEDLQSEIDRLKSSLSELQKKCRDLSEQLDIYQEKALDYSQQNKQLRRELADERFHRSQDSDSRRQNSSHLNDLPIRENPIKSNLDQPAMRTRLNINLDAQAMMSPNLNRSPELGASTNPSNNGQEKYSNLSLTRRWDYLKNPVASPKTSPHKGAFLEEDRAGARDTDKRTCCPFCLCLSDSKHNAEVPVTVRTAVPFKKKNTVDEEERIERIRNLSSDADYDQVRKKAQEGCFCSSLCVDGPHVQSYTANYVIDTVVRDQVTPQAQKRF